MTAKYGRAAILLFSTAVMVCGVLITLCSSIWAVMLGMMLFAARFFAAHAVASGWIGPRTRRARGQASVQLLSGIELRRDTGRCILVLLWLVRHQYVHY